MEGFDLRAIDICAICLCPYNQRNPALRFPNCQHYICKCAFKDENTIIACPFRCRNPEAKFEEMIALPHLKNEGWPTCAAHPPEVVTSICMTHLVLLCSECSDAHTSPECQRKQIDAAERDSIRDDLLEEAKGLEHLAMYLPDHLNQWYEKRRSLSIPKLCELMAALRAASQRLHCHYCSAEAVGLLPDVLIPYCQRHWDSTPEDTRRGATLLAFSSQTDVEVIEILQTEISKYLPRCHFYDITKRHLSARKQPETDEPKMTITKMMTIINEVKVKIDQGKDVYGPYRKEVICPLCEETLSKTQSEVFWGLPCKTAAHAICDHCYRQYSFITCPMDGNSFSKSRLQVLPNINNPEKQHLAAQRPILVPTYRAIMKTRYCVTLFSELAAEGWSVPIEAPTNLLVFSCSADVRLLGMEIGVPTQPDKSISIEQIEVQEGDVLVSTVFTNPREIQVAASPISDVYFSHYVRICPGLRYILKAQFRGDAEISLNQGSREIEETIEGTGGAMWTFERNQELKRGPIVRLIYDRS